MTKTYEKVGKGALFNEDPGPEGKKPVLKGKAEIAGREFGIAAWARVSKSNQNYLSLQFTDPEDTRTTLGDGALFKRDNPNTRAPIMSGPAEIGGRDFALSVWKQTANSGTEYYSLKVELVTEDA
jgi:uncharacterized protein (DUF736 family)